MREIKFRAWDKKNKIMFSVLEFDFEYKELTVMRGEKMSCGCCGNEADTILYFDEAEIMQYTGLKAKRKKEVYDGDILKTTTGNKILIRCNPISLCLEMVFLKKGRNFALNKYSILTCKLIGNIHENPELLK